MKVDWSKFLSPPKNLRPERQEKMETVFGDGEDEDGDDDDPSLPNVKKHLCSHSTDDPFSSLDLLSTSPSSPFVDSRNCPASSNTIGHHLHRVADISQKQPGCEDCLDKSVHPQLAWDAFYSLRDSYCIGRPCKWVVCAEEKKEDIEKAKMFLRRV